MVAGGVGLAPFATLAEGTACSGNSLTLIYGARTDRELFYLDWFRTAACESSWQPRTAAPGDRGRVTIPLERELQAASRS